LGDLRPDTGGECGWQVIFTLVEGGALVPPPDFPPAAIPNLNTQFYRMNIKTKNLAIVCVTRSPTIVST
jgi:hypothetical protein